MAKTVYELRYDDEATRHLRRIPRKHHSLIRRAIEAQLSHEPDRESRNRKPLTGEPPRWELRCGPGNRYRIIYRIDSQAHTVMISIIGVKKGNRLMVNGEEYKP